MDRSSVVFSAILLLLAPVLIPVGILTRNDWGADLRKLEQEIECRRQIVEACRRGDLPATRELTMRWAGIRPDDHRPNAMLITLSAVSMTTQEKSASVARDAARILPVDVSRMEDAERKAARKK